jgi:protein TonB
MRNMKLDAWTATSNPADAARRKRLTIGYAVGAAAVTVGLSFITYTAHGKVFEQEDYIDVSLAKAPVIVADVEPKSTAPRKAQKKKRRRRVSGPPKSVPDSVPEEADPANANPYDDNYDDVFAADGGEQVKRMSVAANIGPKRKVTEKPRVAPKPVLVSERGHSTAPIAVTRKPPTYPEQAREQGIEGTVIVRFIVGADGSVKRIKIIKGHPLLSAAVRAAVMAWRYRPGTYEGQPVSMWRSARFPFRLNT